MALEMLANNLRASPASTLQYSSQATLHTVLDIAAHGGFSLQASALGALAALLPEMPFELIPLQTVVSHLLLALDTWISTIGIPRDPSALQLWQQRMLTCLHLLAGMLEDNGSEAAVADTMLEALSRAVSDLSNSQSQFQARLCQIVQELAEQRPDARHHLTPMLSLLGQPGHLGRAASHCLCLLLRQLHLLHPQHPLFVCQVHSCSSLGQSFKQVYCHIAPGGLYK